MVADMIWGDPVRNEEVLAGSWKLDSRGFGKSPRGGVAVRFGSRAVDTFLTQHGFSRILRAHEAASEGLSFSNAARVNTVFSTSKDHELGNDASCGCVLVENQHLRFFNRARSTGRTHRQQLFRRHNRSRTGCLPNGLPPHDFEGRLSERSASEIYDRTADRGGDDTDDESEENSTAIDQPGIGNHQDNNQENDD